MVKVAITTPFYRKSNGKFRYPLKGKTNMPTGLPPEVQTWVNLIMGCLTAIGIVGSAVIALYVKLNAEVKAAKAKQEELTAADAKTDAHVAENYGTLNAMKAQVDGHGAALVDLAKAVPPAAPTVTVTTTTDAPPPAP